MRNSKPPADNSISWSKRSSRSIDTIANRDKVGLFEAAGGGTLFLDEIGDIPLPLQAKLLRVLQEGSVRRIGSDREVKIDVRVVSATNRELKQAVKTGQFREDLYHRLHVFRIEIPPLRERREDIQTLARFFVEAVPQMETGPVKSISRGALRLLAGYAWPGNVRELENAVRNAYVLSRGPGIESRPLATLILDQDIQDSHPDAPRFLNQKRGDSSSPFSPAGHGESRKRESLPLPPWSDPPRSEVEIPPWKGYSFRHGRWRRRHAPVGTIALRRYPRFHSRGPGGPYTRG
ncbi:MAG: sigma-54-dependent Fis family transcriptional regulator [Nitrospirae bacterium]|nr:sigma-54-dependent Fis family transcriptional regulator [Nitrospirota bacterium]